MFEAATIYGVCLVLTRWIAQELVADPVVTFEKHRIERVTGECYVFVCDLDENGLNDVLVTSQEDYHDKQGHWWEVYVNFGKGYRSSDSWQLQEWFWLVRCPDERGNVIGNEARFGGTRWGIYVHDIVRGKTVTTFLGEIDENDPAIGRDIQSPSEFPKAHGESFVASIESLRGRFTVEKVVDLLKVEAGSSSVEAGDPKEK